MSDAEHARVGRATGVRSVRPAGRTASPVAGRAAAEAWALIATTIVASLLLLNGLSQFWIDTPLNRRLGVGPTCVIVGVLLLLAGGFFGKPD